MSNGVISYCAPERRGRGVPHSVTSENGRTVFAVRGSSSMIPIEAPWPTAAPAASFKSRYRRCLGSGIGARPDWRAETPPMNAND